MTETKEEDKPNSTEETSNEITLYVNNLPFYDCTQDEVQKLFEKYGKVINVTHRQNKKTGTFSGNSFVTFENKEDGEKAIEELNGYLYKDKKLIVEKAKRSYQADYKSNPSEQRRYRDDYDRPRYSRYRDDRFERQYQPRYSSHGYYPEPPYNDYYYQDYDRRPYRYGGEYRDYPDYDRRPPRYRREMDYDSRQYRRSPPNYQRQRSDESE